MTSTEDKPAPIIFGDESLSDVVIVVGNQDFMAHKLILANRSDVFKVMFYGNFKESKEDRVEIKDVSVENFRRFLEIIYTGKTSDPLNFLEFPFSGVSHTYPTGDVEQHLWSDSAEILEIADRFSLLPVVKDYFGNIIPPHLSYCKKNDCHACFNYFVFALINGMDLSKCERKFSRYIYSSWADYAGEKPFPGTLHVKVFDRLFNQLS